MTNTQKAEQARIIQHVRFRRNSAYVVMILGLFLSLFANVMESYGLGPIGWVIAALAPVSLFGCMFLLELLGRDLPKGKLVLSYVVFGGVALCAGYASYLHIYRLTYGVTHDVVYSAIVPLLIDLPMIISSVLLSEARKTLAKVVVPTPPVRRSAASTAGARAIQERPTRARSTRQATTQPAIA